MPYLNLNCIKRPVLLSKSTVLLYASEFMRNNEVILSLFINLLFHVLLILCSLELPGMLPLQSVPKVIPTVSVLKFFLSFFDLPEEIVYLYNVFFLQSLMFGYDKQRELRPF